LSTKEAAASQSGGDICGHLLLEVWSLTSLKQHGIILLTNEEFIA